MNEAAIGLETLGLEEAAALAHTKPSTLRRKAAKGEVPGRKVGKSWVFVKLHLLEWISGRFDPKNPAPVIYYAPPQDKPDPEAGQGIPPAAHRKEVRKEYEFFLKGGKAR